MSEALTADDPRYGELFDAAKEAAQSNDGEVYGDLTPQMNRLRDERAAHKGSLRQLLDVPDLHHAYNQAREHYTIFDPDAAPPELVGGVEQRGMSHLRVKLQ